MDLLAQRYASPFLILDEFIRLNQLHEFLVQTLTRIADEKVHDARWQFWLHRVFNMTFEDYVRRCEEPEQGAQIDYAEIGGIISDSKELLIGFVPEGMKE